MTNKMWEVPYTSMETPPHPKFSEANPSFDAIIMALNMPKYEAVRGYIALIEDAILDSSAENYSAVFIPLSAMEEINRIVEGDWLSLIARYFRLCGYQFANGVWGTNIARITWEYDVLCS